MEAPDGAERAAYIERVAYRDESWRLDAACRNVSPEVNRMFTCLESDRFDTVDGGKVDGFDVQTYLVEVYCLGCPVQWECARDALTSEADLFGDFSTGAWAMTRRDRRWLVEQPDALGIIDAAKWDGVPVAVAVAEARARVSDAETSGV